MPQWAYIVIAVILIIALLILFVVSFVAYVKTPAPEGCEKSYGPNCDNCDQASCQFYHYGEKLLQEMNEKEEAASPEKTEQADSERKE